MNKSQLKTYAPKARRDFIQMIRQQADILGLTKEEIAKPEVKGDVAIIEGRPYPRRYADLHAPLAKTIGSEGLDHYLDRIAYSWFNRFAALRFMEVNGYLSHPFRVLSNREAGKNEPEILEHAAEITLAGLDKNKVIELKLAGNKDAELYKMLLIAQCNELHAAMPFLFERINDETEILLSDNLLHTDSVIRKMVSDIEEENWKEVEIIGWLYQFYISEKKDEVIGKTVKSEDIPAATQLFTPNWIVKYMTQNSLGRLWLEANPDSELKTKVPMEFYIEPAEDNPKVERNQINPEEITVLDPACGSGHILVEAYDLLKAIYTERGYSSKDIPELILKNNLYGLDIDERAAQLSSFALLMKARADDQKLFDNDRGHLVPNIIAVPDSSELQYTPKDIAEMFGDARQADEVVDLLDLFAQGKTLGSLIRIPDGFEKVIDNIEASIAAKFASSDMMEQIAARQLVPFVRAAKMLARKYDCVIANPPYMGSKGMNGELKAFAAMNFPDSKSDLFAMFIERNFELLREYGFSAMVTMQSWMFITSFEKLRERLVTEKTIITMAHLGPRAFAEIGGEVVQTTSFVMWNRHQDDYKPVFFNLVGLAENDKIEALRSGGNRFDRTQQENLNKIPGSPIAYWASDRIIRIFANGIRLDEIAAPGKGLFTGDNGRFIRNWWEIDSSNTERNCQTHLESSRRPGKWYPHNKGGEFRRWYGNEDFVIDFQNDGRNLRRFDGYGERNPEHYFKEGLSWTKVTTTKLSARYSATGHLYDDSACVCPVTANVDVFEVLGYLNSTVGHHLLATISQSMNYSPGEISKLPFLQSPIGSSQLSREMVSRSKHDWDSFETSWDFKTFPILELRSGIDIPPTESVEECWNRWNELTVERISRMQGLETENNRLFIDAYGLQDELSPEVPLDQITLARADKQKDTRRLLSYFIGCLMGRYSLDAPGLIYADAGNVGFDSSRYRTFPADDDGIVLLTDIEWFPQEAARQFEKFMRTAWSDGRLAENLRWVAAQLSPKAGEEPIETIRRYFSTSFFKDHMQTYKKRPIYWQFSSGKQKAFECLVYLHRYNESTLPRMRHEYVLPLMSKIEAQIETLAGHADEYGTRSGGLLDTSGSTSERNKLAKQLETLKKKQVELATFDEKLRHYADMRISLDLDDGVKMNYSKFGDLLAEVKTITGTKD